MFSTLVVCEWFSEYVTGFVPVAFVVIEKSKVMSTVSEVGFVDGDKV